MAREKPDPKRRHLRAIPDLTAHACMYAGTDNGPCGGQTTQYGDGRDYCMDHAFLRLPHG